MFQMRPLNVPCDFFQFEKLTSQAVKFSTKFESCSLSETIAGYGAALELKSRAVAESLDATRCMELSYREDE